MQDVEWGEYRLGDLFEIKTSVKRFDANKVNILNNGKYPYIVRMSFNNGQKGFLNENPTFLNDGNTISFGQDTATMYYQEIPYFTGDKIKILFPKVKQFGRQNVQFFLTAMKLAFSCFSWGSSNFNVKTIKSQTINLPSKNGEIDFDFMERFIAKLEEERIQKLIAYLKASGLDNYELTKEETEVLHTFESRVFEEFTYDSIFNRIKQGKRLKKEDQISGDIPFVMSGINNNGVANYVSNPATSFPGNSITIDIFGNSFYRDYDFGAGDDTGVYWNDKIQYSKETMLFFTSAMEKSIRGKFSYGKKLRSSQSLKFNMMLPAKNGKPDFETMETLISAVQKLVIKDVVLYADKKIEAAKTVVHKNQS